jgi:hypothetical protein
MKATPRLLNIGKVSDTTNPLLALGGATQIGLVPFCVASPKAAEAAKPAKPAKIAKAAKESKLRHFNGSLGVKLRQWKHGFKKKKKNIKEIFLMKANIFLFSFDEKNQVYFGWIVTSMTSIGPGLAF